MYDVRSLPAPSHSMAPPHTHSKHYYSWRFYHYQRWRVIDRAGIAWGGVSKEGCPCLYVYIMIYLHIYICILFKQYIYMICVCALNNDSCTTLFWFLESRLFIWVSRNHPNKSSIVTLFSLTIYPSKLKFLQSLHTTDLSNFQPQWPCTYIYQHYN